MSVFRSMPMQALNAPAGMTEAELLAWSDGVHHAACLFNLPNMRGGAPIADSIQLVLQERVRGRIPSRAGDRTVRCC